MAASSVSDIPDGMIKGKYCKCNNCKISREEGREEMRYIIRNLAKSYDTSGDQTLWRVGQDLYRLIEGDK